MKQIIYCLKTITNSLILITLLSCSTFVIGETYTIGNGPTSGNNYETLEDLRVTLGTLANGDTLIFYKDDYSLTQNIILPNDVSQLTIRSNDPSVTREIGQASRGDALTHGGVFVFDGAVNAMTLESIVLNQNSVTKMSNSDNYGGAIYSHTDLTINGQT